MPPKSKERETLRRKILETRAGARGRPLDPPRNEKVLLERERVFGIGLVAKANKVLERAVDGQEVGQQQIEAARQILDRYGQPKKTHTEVSTVNDFEVFLLAVAPSGD